MNPYLNKRRKGEKESFEDYTNVTDAMLHRMCRSYLAIAPLYFMLIVWLDYRFQARQSLKHHAIN
jgi:hypothetical protein